MWSIKSGRAKVTERKSKRQVAAEDPTRQCPHDSALSRSKCQVENPGVRGSCSQ